MLSGGSPINILMHAFNSIWWAAQQLILGNSGGVFVPFQ